LGVRACETSIDIVDDRNELGCENELSGQVQSLQRRPRESQAQQQQNPDFDKGVFRQRREKSTALVVSIVLIFVLCHVCRLVVQMVEISVSDYVTEEHYRHCHKQGRHHVPVALRLLLVVNHICVVVNSSVNFVVYCLVGKEFRERLKGCCKTS
jgi:hypothetical protein